MLLGRFLPLTTIFANLAEAVAEGRGKAQADTLRKAKTDTVARRLTGKVEASVPRLHGRAHGERPQAQHRTEGTHREVIVFWAAADSVRRCPGLSRRSGWALPSRRGRS
jgi:hypothetical protein